MRLPWIWLSAVAVGALAGSWAIGRQRHAELDWQGFGNTPGAESYSAAAKLDTANVGRLGLAWSYDLPAGNSVTEPVEADGVVYTSTRLSVVTALDAVTGKELWTYDTKTIDVAGKKLRYAWGSRGLAYGDGRIFVGTQDGRLVTLAAKTGRLLWSVVTTEPGDDRYITGPPRVFGGKVLIGHGGGDYVPERGYVTCYDAASGKPLWRFYTVPGPGSDDEVQAMAVKTWSGDSWKAGGGGMVWHGISYDPEFNRFYIETGNAEPESPGHRIDNGSDNLFSASIIALDADTGKYVWHYQVVPGEEWDFDVTGDLVPATLTIDGKPRKVLMNAPKDGFFYVLDRTNGKLISAEPFAKVNWASKIDLVTGRPVENPALRYSKTKTDVLVWPSPSGAHNWLPMAFSPKTGLVYIPVSEHPMILGETTQDLAPHHDEPDVSLLEAWNPVTQKAVWSVDTAGLWGGGVMATGGGLVFQGQADRKFNAYDALSGKRLWTFDAHAPIQGPPITYTVKGVQYVTVITGYGMSPAVYGRANYTHGALDLDYRTMQRRVLTFALGGKAALPPAPAQAPHTPPPDPTFAPDPVRAEAGHKLFGANCIVCHGFNAIAAGAAPDLRWSPVPVSGPAFQTIVQKGALLQKGMPRFDELSDAQIEDIRFYIRTRSHEAE